MHRADNLITFMCLKLMELLRVCPGLYRDIEIKSGVHCPYVA